MAGLRVIMAALVVGSALASLPVGAQTGSSASLTHTVTVSVPPRLKVQVANLAFASATPASVSSVQPKIDGLSITINATQAWVLSIGSASGVDAAKSRAQWSTDTNSGYSTVTPASSVVASGTSYDAKSASVFFRGPSGSRQSGSNAETVVLTVSAP